MKKKLSKTEKIKRLRKVKIQLKQATCSWEYYMCHIYHDIYNVDLGALFLDIPELFKFRPKGTSKHIAWVWVEYNTFEDAKQSKINAIDKAIKLIQSK